MTCTGYTLAYMDSMKIVTPVGMLGYGYSTPLLYKGFKMGAQAIILHSGSTDSGPQKLALGETACHRESYIRDLVPIWMHAGIIV